MSQYYNPQGYQAYPNAARQQGMPFAGQSGFQPMQMQPPSASGGMPPGMGGMPGGGAPGGVPGMLPLEQSYIENILRLNKGKLVHVFTTFENNNQWNAKEFVGIIEAAGRDHLILSDPQSGKRYLIPMVHLDYVTFEEEVEYEPQFGGGGAGLSTYSPR
jgi:spore germination protein Q